jgi:hypothetical protein
VRKRLGEILIERQLVSVEQLNVALAHQREWGMRLGAALVAKGFIAEGTLTRVLSESLGIPMVDLAKVVADKNAIELVPIRVCEQYDVFPIALKQARGRRVLLLAMADPLNMTAIDEIAFATGCTVQPSIAQISSLDQALRRFYHGERVEISPLNFDRTPLTRAGAPAAGAPAPPAARATAPMPTVAATAEGEEMWEDHPTGTFSLPPVSDPDGAVVMGTVVGAADPAPIAAEWDATESIEERFWALMRVLANRGLITKEEYLAELKWRGREG